MALEDLLSDTSGFVQNMAKEETGRAPTGQGEPIYL